MKRIMSALISFCMIMTGILSCFSTSVYASGTDEVYDEAFEFLKYLEITADTDKLDKKLTRADFAVYTGNILKIDNYMPNEKRYFSDVPMDHWALNSINSLAEMKVISGDGTGKFYPFDEITQGAAVKILLSLMGYDLYAEMKGGYPMGYVAVARETKLATGVEWDKPLTKERALKWIYEALHIKLMEPTVFGQDEYTWNTSKDMTLLSLYRDIETVEGVLSCVEGISVDKVSVGKNQLMLDGEIYSFEGINPLPYLGMTVRAYYKEDKTPAGKNIFYMWELDKKNNVITVDISDFKSFDEDEYKVFYYDNDKEAAIKISKGVGIVRNFGYESGNVVNAMKSFKKGSLTFIDNNRDDIYDYMLIMDYRNMVVGAIDKTEHIIYDKYIRAEKLELDLQSETISFYKADKSLGAFEDIKEESLITVYENGEYISVNICDKSLYGTIWGTRNKNGKTQLKIGQNSDDALWYTVDEDFMKATSYSFKTGEEITALLDMFGNIAEVLDKKASDMTYGFLVGCFEGEGLDKTAKIRIFTQDNKMEAYALAKRVNVDSANTASYNEFMAALEKGKSGAVGQLIRFKLNTNNEVSAIDTVYLNEAKGESEISLHNTNKNVNTYYQEGTGQFGIKILSGGSTMFFAVPEDAALANAKDDDFNIIKQSYFVQSENYTVDTYKTDVRSGYEEVLIIRTSADMPDTIGDMFLVTGFFTGLDEEENVVDIIEGYSNGIKYSYVLSDNSGLNPENVDEGDIVKLHTDGDGKVSDVTMIYDYSVGGKPPWAPQTTATFYDDYRIVYGNVISVRDNVLKLGYDSIETPDEVVGLGSVSSILIYDSSVRNEDEKVYVGGVSDLYAAETVGADCSKIFMRTKWQKPLWLIVYK
ncbi:MAG: S-layer homology domain-containing protein [Ruminococcaceae bacterium]|nr:S-layer homology domain-containing protein [Oscillospiraceae bacterium]